MARERRQPLLLTRRRDGFRSIARTLRKNHREDILLASYGGSMESDRTPTRWSGLATLPVVAFEKVPLSLDLGQEPAILRPTAEDYAACLREGGHLPGDDSLDDHPLLVAQAQAHWHSSSFNGCVFSAFLSDHRTTHRWDTYVIENAGSPAANASVVAELVQRGLDDVEVEIVSVIAPFVEDTRELAELVAALREHAGWAVDEVGEETDSEHGELVRLGIRVVVRPPAVTTAEQDHNSEVLGFGPQHTGARTRRAPFTELAVRAKSPDRPKTHRRAHMAQVMLFDQDVKVGSARIAQWGAETNQLRGAILGEDHQERGKAKVSFTIPRDQWREATR